MVTAFLSLTRRIVTLAVVISCGMVAVAQDVPKKSENLFRPTKTWTVHLRFTPEQWSAMEPKGGGGFLGGMLGGGGDFGMGMFLAPVVMQAADKDENGTLSAEEFRNLGSTWFKEWTKENDSPLDADKIRDGLNAFLRPPGGGQMEMGLKAPEGGRNGVAGMMGIEFSYVHADLDFEGRSLQNVGVRYKGNGTFLTSRASLKRSFKIDLNKFVKGQKLAEQTTINLHNNVTDRAWMNEVLAYRLYRDAGVPAPHTAYARVHVTVPGKHDNKYLGLYTIVENVDKNFLSHQLDVPGGALFKPSSPNLFTDLGDDWKRYQQTYDPKTELTNEQEKRLIEFCQFVSKSDDADFASRLADFIDIDESARYMAVLTYLSNPDSLLMTGQNFYLYLHPKTNKFMFLPWDQDHSFGQFIGGGQDDRDQLSIHKPWGGEKRFLKRVFAVESFKKLYLARLVEFSKTIFQPSRFDEQVAELAEAIRPAVKEESSQKLSRFETIVAGKTPPRAMFDFGASSQTIRGFAKARSESLTDQLTGKAKGREFGNGGMGRPNDGKPDPGPGEFVGRAMIKALDTNRDKSISRDEFVGGFDKWFIAWDTEKKGQLSEKQLRTGLNKVLPFPSPFESRDKDAKKPADDKDAKKPADDKKP